MQVNKGDKVRIVTDTFTQAGPLAKGTIHEIASLSEPVYFTSKGFALFTVEFERIVDNEPDTEWQD